MSAGITITQKRGWTGLTGLLECIIQYIRSESLAGNVRSETIIDTFSESYIKKHAVLEIRHINLIHFCQEDISEFRSLLIRMKDSFPDCAVWWKPEAYSLFYQDVDKLIRRVDETLADFSQC